MKNVFVALVFLLCCHSLSKAEGIFEDSLSDIEVSGMVRYRFETSHEKNTQKQDRLRTTITIR